MAATAEEQDEKVLEEGRAALIRGWASTGEPPILFTKARGALLWDDEGREYIDCTAQAWSTNIAAGDPRVLAAAEAQMRDVAHLRMNYDSYPLLRLAQRMVQIAPEPLTKVGFCLHGSLANEMAMKIALKNTPGGGTFITLYDGYHGRSMATIAASWPHFTPEFRTFMPRVVRVPQAYCYRCPLGLKRESCELACATAMRSAIRQGVDGKPSGVIMEPIQGNGGQIDFPREYYHEVRRICDEEGVLLIWDEIQTGFGRMGTMFGCEYYGVVPDILTFGKAAGGGFPLAGILMRGDLKPFSPGDDALTFGSWPVSMAAGLATIDVIEEDDLLAKCRALGEHATERLKEMQERHPLIGDIRGPGLMIGIELVEDRVTKEPAVDATNEVYERGLEQGVIFGTSRYGGIGNVVKIKPSLSVTLEQLDRAIDVFDAILTDLEAERSLVG